MSSSPNTMALVFTTDASQVRRTLEDIRQDARDKGIQIPVTATTDYGSSRVNEGGPATRGGRVRVGSQRELYEPTGDPWAHLDAPYSSGLRRAHAREDRSLGAALDRGFTQSARDQDRATRQLSDAQEREARARQQVTERLIRDDRRSADFSYRISEDAARSNYQRTQLSEAGDRSMYARYAQLGERTSAAFASIGEDIENIDFKGSRVKGQTRRSRQADAAFKAVSARGGIVEVDGGSGGGDDNEEPEEPGGGGGSSRKGGFFGLGRWGRLSRYLGAGAIAYEALRAAQSYRTYNTEMAIAGNNPEEQLKAELGLQQSVEGIPLLGQSVSLITDPSGSRRAQLELGLRSGQLQDAQGNLILQQNEQRRNIVGASTIGTQRDPYQRAVLQADFNLSSAQITAKNARDEVTTAAAQTRDNAIATANAHYNMANMSKESERPSSFGSMLTSFGEAYSSGVWGGEERDKQIDEARKNRSTAIDIANFNYDQTVKAAQKPFDASNKAAQDLHDYDVLEAGRQQRLIQMGLATETSVNTALAANQPFEAQMSGAWGQLKSEVFNAQGTGTEGDVLNKNLSNMVKVFSDFTRSVRSTNLENFGNANISNLQANYQGREVGLAQIDLKYQREKDQAPGGIQGFLTSVGINVRETAEKASFTKRFDDAEKLYVEGLERNKKVMETLASGRDKSAKAEGIIANAEQQAAEVANNPNIVDKRRAKRAIFGTAEAEENAYLRELAFESVGSAHEVSPGTIGNGFYGTKSQLQENPWDAMKAVHQAIQAVHGLMLQAVN